MLDDYYAPHESFMTAVRGFVADRFAPRLGEWQRAGRFPDEVFRELGAQGYLGVLVSERFGGVGGDLHLAAAWCEAFGTLCDVGLTTAVNMHSLVISHAVERLATEEVKERYLPGAMRGDEIGAYAFTEPGAGSDLASVATSATRDGGDWILRGRKTFITNGGRATFVLVLARSDPAAGRGGFTTFLVDKNLPGFSVARTLDKLGWHSSDTAELVLDDVRVPAGHVLGSVGEGWNQAAANLGWERMMLTLLSLSGARTALEGAVRYAAERTVRGAPISDIPAVRGLLDECRRAVIVGEALTYRALDALRAGAPDAAVLVAAAKRRVCEDAVKVADRAIQVHGGYGYTTEFLPERWWRDLRLMTIGGGTSEVMAGIVRKGAAAAGRCPA